MNRYRVREKLNSRKGASLAMVVLLFMVCAVLGSVVLTAGTASSGRLSELSAMDRRYYAVTSAAELFRDTLDGKTYTVVRRQRITSTVYEGDPAKPDKEDTEYIFQLKIGDAEPAELDYKVKAEDFLTQAVLDYVFGPETAGLSEADAYSRPSGAVFSKQLDVEGPETLKVRVTADMDMAGKITFAFTNLTDGGDEPPVGERFSVSFVLDGRPSPDNEPVPHPEERITHYDESSAEDPKPISFIEIVNVAEERNDVSFRWTAGEIRKD